jgi:hypothetical protein
VIFDAPGSNFGAFVAGYGSYLEFTDGTTTNFTGMTINGTSGHNCTITGTSTGGFALSGTTAGINTATYTTISYSTATGTGVTWDALTGNGCTDGGSNNGWIFDIAPVTTAPGWTVSAATPSATPTPTPSATPAVVPGQIPTTPASVQLPTQSQILDFVSQSLKNIKSLIPQALPPIFTQPTTNPPSNLQPNQPPPTQAATPAASNQIIVIQVLQKLLKALTDLLNAVFK